ncbi:glycoside hydrolase family 17 protein [Xylaria telfairii]|nr:glycoside hydrolase family 17 protein [Xylaria telfairii]
MIATHFNGRNMLYHILFTLLASARLCHSLTASNRAVNCFPYGSAVIPKDLSVPNVSLNEWRCPLSMAYGFQGFSYPLEESDCSAFSNSFESMNADFAQMKRDFGARIVRLYYPLCLNASVFENALKAGVANNMAVIFQVWTDFGTSDAWKLSQQAIYDVLESPVFGPIAPYVVHSIDFGSEPVTDGMDGIGADGGKQFIKDLGLLREKANSYGIPAGISEEWDRPSDMRSQDGTGLGDIGTSVKANSDYCHAHIMPYYHSDITLSGSWAYIQGQIDWINKTVGLPTMITETQWAWGQGWHAPQPANKSGITVAGYTQYWQKFDEECELFKRYQVGWFLHTWRGESTFDIVYPDNGSYVIPKWRPRIC